MQSCIFHSHKIPVYWVKLRKSAEAFVESDDPAWKISNVIVKLAGFRAHIRDRVLYDPISIVNAGMKLDLEFSSLGKRMPTQ